CSFPARRPPHAPKTRPAGVALGSSSVATTLFGSPISRPRTPSRAGNLVPVRPKENPMLTRCDNGHEHATLYDALTCVRGLGKATTQAPSEGPSSAPGNPSTSQTVFRHGRAGKSGRPRVPEIEQRRKARERTRSYRERQKENGNSSAR